ncbi:MAG: hypothetical protein KHY83_02585 [Coriobacteriia bacterium]|nr:hypothetical protein [Coriobacteriia bacterium]
MSQAGDTQKSAASPEAPAGKGAHPPATLRRIIDVARDNASLVAGLAALLSVADFLSWGGAVTTPKRAFSTEQIYAFFTIPCFMVLGVSLLAAAIALSARPCDPLACRVSHVAPAAEAIGLAGGLCALAALLSATAAHPLLLACASAALGLGLAAGFIAWGRALSRLEIGSLVTTVGCACVLFPLASLVTTFAPALVAYAITGMLVCCSVSTALHAQGGRSTTCPQAGLPAAGDTPSTGSPAPTRSPIEGASDRADDPAAGSTATESAPAPAGASPVRALWASYGVTALSFGSLGFVAGLSRMVSLDSGANGTAVMLGSPTFTLIAGAVMLALWHRFGRLVSPGGLFQAMFPFAVSGFALFTITGLGFSTAFACLANFFFEFMLVVITVHSIGAQTPADSAGQALPRYSLALGLAFVLACLGTIVSMLTRDLWQDRDLGFVLSIVVCIYVLSMALVLQVRNRQGGERHSAPGSANASEDPRRPDGPAASIESAIGTWVAQASPAYDLTPREAEILALILQGADTPAMAARLGVSDNTVRTHKKRLYRKLDVHSKQDLLALMRSEGDGGAGASA